MSKRILTDSHGSEVTAQRLDMQVRKDIIRLYGTDYPEKISQYAVIIADDNLFDGL